MADFRFLAPLAVLVGLLLSVPTASASHVQCGDTIAQDTTLDSNLACPSDALTIGGPVTLDLAGHTINGSGSGMGVVSWNHHFQIRGGRIHGFQEGVFSESDGVLVTDMVFERNGAGVSCHYGTPCIVEDSTLRRNGVGLDLSAADGGGDVEIRRNRI